MRKLILALILLAQISGPNSLGAQEKNKLVFAVDPTYPPLEFLEGEQVVGYGPDYFAAVCREAGLTAEFKAVAWDDIFKNLDAGAYDAVASSVTITPERRQSMDFTIPYYVVRQSLFVPQNSTVNDIRQLSGLRVGTQEETTATSIVEKISGAESVPFPSIGEAFQAMAAGNLEAIICEDVVGASFLKEAEYAGKFKVAEVINTPGAEELYGAAVRKGNTDVLILLNDGIKAVKEKGIEDELRRKWISE